MHSWRDNWSSNNEVVLTVLTSDHNLHKKVIKAAGKVKTKGLSIMPNVHLVNQIDLGVQDCYIRTGVQGDLGTVHVAQLLQKAADLKDKICFNCGKKGYLAENCPEP